jgi:hypothetical protein
MASDNEDAKLEKKRLKAQFKAEKARAKAAGGKPLEPAPAKTPTRHPEVKVVIPEQEKVPWYKNPDWVRAIAAIAALIVMAITLILTVL